MELYDYQIEAVNKLHNGAILCGGVGSGKSRTSLYYFLTKVCGGRIRLNGTGTFETMKEKRNLYIITTAKKRDSLEWEEECAAFAFDKVYGINVTVDSWNNIKKYVNIYGAFFIFDEQRVVGSGAWVKAFLTISRKNKWILLTATPGDQWSDYIPVFVANGFYKNKTEFCRIHCVYSRFAKYPKIEKYIGLKLLEKNRDAILVPMRDLRLTTRHDIFVNVDYDRGLYRTVMVDRWDPYDDEPIAETGKLLYLLRKVVNSDVSRLCEVGKIVRKKRKAIIFYNYTYELNLLRDYFHENLLYVHTAEWNGEKHENVPTDVDYWAYLVQYSAGCEGWNCIDTDTIIFFSQTYSYRTLEQASGRIDRINTPFKDLYYYHLRSSAPIDMAIYRKLRMKENFNERAFLRRVKM